MKKKPKFKRLRSLKTAPKRLPRLRVSARLKHKREATDEKLVQAIQNLPRITNETVAEHREEVLSSARKYIYPLSHSKRRIIVVTSSLLVLALVIFFVYCGLALYKFKSNSTFMYGVTQVIPFPVAKAGGSWVSYESYLFELRHSIHYYQTQQKEDFNSKAGKQHLAKLEQDAMNQVVEDAYVKQLASKNHVSVSAKAVDNEVTLLKSENRLGSNDEVFRTVLSEFWGWTVNDFKRELRQQLLAQAVVAKLDTKTQARANAALNQIKSGADFAAVAKQYSDDLSTKDNGGNYGIAITPTNRDLPIQVIDDLFKLKPGETSGLINTGYTLEIDKVIDTTGSSVHASRIVFNLQPIATYTKPLQSAHKPHYYISVPKSQS